MKKEKVDPKHPPLKDLQGHTYQHELGDPDAAEKINRIIGSKGKAKGTRPGRPRTGKGYKSAA
ncbi:MAG TPA: hypothetical protein VGK48_26385 [Terriglobia bacterium]|jgi:hypothetical protein